MGKTPSVAEIFVATDEFLRRYENNQMEKTLEYAEWVGEQCLLKRLKEKAKIRSPNG
ncbi:hypothetical protein L0337_34870 [candidate division KSB1 bacterium]|nr:hypothetical protein [candidate division KSB1 bacterium]